MRLLADTPGACSYEYDGGGHRLVLPDKDHLGGFKAPACPVDALSLLIRGFELVAASGLGGVGRIRGNGWSFTQLLLLLIFSEAFSTQALAPHLFPPTFLLQMSSCRWF